MSAAFPESEIRNAEAERRHPAAMPSMAAVRRDQERREASERAEQVQAEDRRVVLPNRQGDYLVGQVVDGHGRAIEVHSNIHTGIVTARTGPAHIHVLIQLHRERAAELGALLERAARG